MKIWGRSSWAHLHVVLRRYLNSSTVIFSFNRIRSDREGTVYQLSKRGRTDLHQVTGGTLLLRRIRQHSRRKRGSSSSPLRSRHALARRRKVLQHMPEEALLLCRVQYRRRKAGSSPWRRRRRQLLICGRGIRAFKSQAAEAPWPAALIIRCRANKDLHLTLI